MLPEFTKEMEKSIREQFSKHDKNGTHTMIYEHCPACTILLLLAEIERLIEENMKLRVNP